jgi:hypothetical protein
VARTQELIGRSEYVDWVAYFEIVAEEEKAAINKARSGK